MTTQKLAGLEKRLAAILQRMAAMQQHRGFAKKQLLKNKRSKKKYTPDQIYKKINRRFKNQIL